MSALIKQSGARQLRLIFQQLTAVRALSLSSKCYADKDSEKLKSSSEHFDIIIGGGGLVGTTLALALAKNKVLSEKRILLLEGAPPFKGFNVEAQYGNRVSAINNNSVELFKSIDAWDYMQERRVKHVKQMQVWDACSDALIQFQDEHFSADVACIVENDLMLDAMYAQLADGKSAPNVEVRNNTRIEGLRLSVDTGEMYSQVHLKDGQTLTCELLVGADGANSLVRKEMNIDVFTVDYERRGVVATVKLEDACDNAVAWQRFLPTGPVALLPLSDTLSSVVWSTTIPHAKQLLQMPQEDFAKALNEAFFKEYPKEGVVISAMNTLNSLIGRNPNILRQYPPGVNGVIESSRASFPLGFLHASSYVCTGAALIGDAAHRVHPLAGQGVNLGYSDVRELVQVLADAAYAGAKLSDRNYLVKYEQRSLTKNVPIMIGVHGLHTLYSTTFTPVVLLRSLGLQLTDSIVPIKNLFMKRAMG
ncbi:ubiquinone biosynthesis monooxygenase COQ6, mitochondrial [Anastrepha ludens]|uniref:ubiquinone biosynthesis monooxygenase COQ6, mitochondrial n=1 Tax=Anastrepha ludens TaxID=28586 RepID=UPI0023AEFF7C|nr:ubiquinone biosynthesis monooxygenase COQ6, mitochondrial [Anastrepha ludens]